MNVIYESVIYLPVYPEIALRNFNLAEFFSTHKKSCIFVTDDQGVLKGFINHQHYRQCPDNPLSSIHTFPIMIEYKDLPQINLTEFFSSNLSCGAIPVMYNGSFIGAFLKNYSEELVAFDRLTNKIALNSLKYFRQELIDYLLSKSICSISFIGEEEDRKKLKEIIEGYTTVLSEGDFNGQIIIDTIHSKSYRDNQLNNRYRTYSLEELLTIILIPFVKMYCHKRRVQIQIYEGPCPEKLHSSNVHGVLPPHIDNLEEALTDQFVCEKFSAGNLAVLNFLKDGSNGPLKDNYVTTNGLHLLMGIKNRGVEATYENNIHLYGSCLTYGMCVPEQLSISAIMNPRMAEMGYGVINHGVKNGHSLLNDFLYILNTPLKPNDKIIIINVFSEKVLQVIKDTFTIKELSNTLNLNDDMPWYFLDNTFHINHIANQIISDELCKSITLYEDRHDEKAEIESCMKQMQEKLTPNGIGVCEEWVLGSYKEYLLAHKRPQMNMKIGSVLLTANPITLGHLHLIQYAKAHCDLLYVFIVEEDLFFFTTAERMLLTQMTITDPDIIIVSTGSMMTAQFTFPEYFTKSSHDYKITHENIPDIHCEIFGKFVCPLLGITVRFVGEEKLDSVTMAYNRKLQSFLPLHGIEVVEIPRLKLDASYVISSSSVRKAIEEKEFEKIKNFVPEVVERYIQEKWNQKN